MCTREASNHGTAVPDGVKLLLKKLLIKEVNAP